MSFAHTTAQMRAREKTVTRRIGWQDLRPGTMLLAVEKVMGLRKGQRQEVLGTIRVVSVRQETLGELLRADNYGVEEMALEGFPGRSPQDFVSWLIGCTPGLLPESVITRIEFEHCAALPGAWPFPRSGLAPGAH